MVGNRERVGECVDNVGSNIRSYPLVASDTYYTVPNIVSTQ